MLILGRKIKCTQWTIKDLSRIAVHQDLTFHIATGHIPRMTRCIGEMPGRTAQKTVHMGQMTEFLYLSSGHLKVKYTEIANIHTFFFYSCLLFNGPIK